MDCISNFNTKLSFTIKGYAKELIDVYHLVRHIIIIIIITIFDQLSGDSLLSQV